MRLNHIGAAIACLSHVAHMVTARAISVRNSVVAEAADHLWEQIQALNGPDPLAGATPGSSVTLAQSGDASMGVYVIGEANGDGANPSSDSNANADSASTTQAQPTALRRRDCVSGTEPKWSDVDRLLEMIYSKGLNVMVPQMRCKWFTYGTATSEICNNNRCASAYLTTDWWGYWMESLRSVCVWEHQVGWQTMLGDTDNTDGPNPQVSISIRRTGTENPSPSPPEPGCDGIHYMTVNEDMDWWL